MTCIIGYIEKAPNKTTIYLGGDSAGTSGSDIIIRTDPKVFKKKNKTDDFLFGFTSSYRMGQLLISPKFTPPPQKENISDFEYMISDFIDEIRKTMKNGGYSTIQNNEEVGGVFFVAYRGHLYTIGIDFQVGETSLNYSSIGSGEDIANGALYILSKSDKSPHEIIKKSLEATAYFKNNVHGPFKIISLIYNK